MLFFQITLAEHNSAKPKRVVKKALFVKENHRDCLLVTEHFYVIFSQECKRIGYLMGTWGSGTLENDTAQDFFAVIFELNFKSFRYLFNKKKFLHTSIVEALDNTNFYQASIAASEAIAASFGVPNPDLEQDYIKLSEDCNKYLTSKDVNKAINILESLLVDQEVLDGWLNEGSKSAWQDSVRNLISRLNSIQSQ